MLPVLLAAARFLHYAAATALFGAALFPLYGFVPGRGEASVEQLTRTVRRVSAAAALATALAWFLLSSAGMSGELSGAVDLETLWFVASSTAFGHVTIARLLAAAAAVWAATRPAGDRLNATIAGLLLASIALTGHTQVEKGLAGLVHVVADAAHLLGAGAWLGALAPLLALAAIDPQKARARGVDIGVVLANFSGVGVAAVAALVATGLINSWFLVGPHPLRLVSTPYGRVLLVKLLLFAGMLGLAAANRVWITVALNIALPTDQTRPWLRRLRRHIAAEQALGLLVLAAVGYLGTLEPAIGE